MSENLTTRPEVFIELLPPDVGHNLRHLGPETAHVTGDECHCGPERIPHEVSRLEAPRTRDGEQGGER